MLAGDVLSLDGDGLVTRERVGTVAAVIRPRTGGGEVIALERGFALRGAGSAELCELPPLWTTDTLRMNEGACAPDGSLWCGSMAYEATQGAGTLYRLDPDLTVTVALSDVTISNGIDWSPDGGLVYYVDTPTRRVDVFDWSPDAGLTNRRMFVAIPDEAGTPDGLTVDADGGVWVALWGGGAVHRYLPSGQLDAVVEIGARQVTACAIGAGALYVTTSRLGLGSGQDPLAGCVFRADIAVGSQPVRTFAG